MKSSAVKKLLVIAAGVLLCGGVNGKSVDNMPKSTNKVMKIGWGRRSIAPSEPVTINGQFYLRISLGVYKPVIASALVMENGDDAVIFVSVDMVSAEVDLLKLVRKNLAAEIKGFPVDKIILNSTHTHAGPSSRSNAKTKHAKGIKFMPIGKLREFLARQITDAVKEAWETRSEGSIAYGYGFATTGHSRRTIYLDDISKREKSTPGVAMNGHGKMYGSTRDTMFDCYEAGSDSFINLFYTFDKAGKLTGAVINVPCPSQTGEHAWVLHASFWNNVREKLAAKYGDIGVICQSAAAGDLSPRQLHYREAEMRRYQLKYADKIAEYKKNPMAYPAAMTAKPEDAERLLQRDIVEWMRAEDIANRITDAFDEVLSWAKKDIRIDPELKHEVRRLKLSRRMFPQELIDQELANYELLQKELQASAAKGDKYDVMAKNSALASRRGRIEGVMKRAKLQEKEPYITTDIHVVRIGDIAFASNRFELYMDFMHRIQARSPFEQTFIVQLVTDPNGVGSYLATERGQKNRGYSATPYCNQVSPQGGQELVNETLKVLEELKK